MKGKKTRHRTPVVGTEDIVHLPKELEIKSTEIAADIVFIEDQACVNTIDPRIKFRRIAPFGTKKNVTALEFR